MKIFAIITILSAYCVSPLALAQEFTNPVNARNIPAQALRSGGSMGGGSGGAMLDHDQWPQTSLRISIEEFNQIMIDAGLQNPVVIDNRVLTPAMIDMMRRKILLQDEQDHSKLITIEVSED